MTSPAFGFETAKNLICVCVMCVCYVYIRVYSEWLPNFASLNSTPPFFFANTGEIPIHSKPVVVLGLQPRVGWINHGQSIFVAQITVFQHCFIGKVWL